MMGLPRPLHRSVAGRSFSPCLESRNRESSPLSSPSQPSPPPSGLRLPRFARCREEGRRSWQESWLPTNESMTTNAVRRKQSVALHASTMRCIGEGLAVPCQLTIGEGLFACNRVYETSLHHIFKPPPPPP